MNDGEALLRNILLNPADDMARLIYADWLEDNGQGKRAEFIRLQMRIAELGKNVSALMDGHISVGVEYSSLIVRRDRLWWEWFANRHEFKLPDSIGLPADAVQRGFISSISCTAAEFVTHARTLFSQHPIERVKLTDRIKMHLHATDSQREFVMRHRVGRWDFCIGPTEVICVDNGAFDYSMTATLLTDLFADALSGACVAYGREQAGLTRLNFLPADPPWKLRTISNPIPT